MPGAKASTELSRLPAARDGELVLRMADALLQLPAVGVGLAALDTVELGLRLLELAPGPRVVDLVRGDCVVDERERAVVLDLEEPGAGRELVHLRLRDVDARR